jgi:hypothetical protein
MCAEQIAVSIGDQAGICIRPIDTIKADQCGDRAGVAAGGLGDLEHRAATIHPPPTVVPNRLPSASAIRAAFGAVASMQFVCAQKLTNAVRLAARDWPGATTAKAAIATSAEIRGFIGIEPDTLEKEVALPRGAGEET